MKDPLYKKVLNIIVERIANGQYVPGSMLPSEILLAIELNVSQGTARKALFELERKGIVQRRQGKGTFVTLRTPENSLFHFFRLRDKSGAQVAPQLETETVVQRTARKSERNLLFGKPEKVFEINRVRSFKGTPLCHEKTIVPTQLFLGLKDRSPLPNALYVLFQHAYSCIVISAEESLTAATLDETTAAELQVPVGTPVIIAHRRAYDLLERLVELRISTLLTEEASYFVDLK